MLKRLWCAVRGEHNVNLFWLLHLWKRMRGVRDGYSYGLSGGLEFGIRFIERHYTDGSVLWEKGRDYHLRPQ